MGANLVGTLKLATLIGLDTLADCRLGEYE